MTNEQLLIEVEDLLRTTPTRNEFGLRTGEGDAWLGRALAIVNAWDPLRAIMFRALVNNFNAMMSVGSMMGDNLANVMAIIHEVRYDLRMKTTGPLSVAVGSAKPFDYFDEVRKIIEQARQDL